MYTLTKEYLGLNNISNKDIRTLAHAKADCLLEDRITDLEKLARLSDYVSSVVQTNKNFYIQAMTEVILGVDTGIIPAITPASAVAKGLWAGEGNKCNGWGRDPLDCNANYDRSSGTSRRYWLQDTGFHSDYRDYHNQVFHFWASVAAVGEYTDELGTFLSASITYVGLQVFHEGIEAALEHQGATWQDYALTEMGLNLGQRIASGRITPLQAGNWMRDNLSRPFSGERSNLIFQYLLDQPQNPEEDWYRFDCTDPTVCYPGDLPENFPGF